MLKDHNHDLIHSLSEKNDGVWRYKQYMDTSKGCEHCSTIWKQMEMDDNKHIEMLKSEIKRHFDENRFD